VSIFSVLLDLEGCSEETLVEVIFMSGTMTFLGVTAKLLFFLIRDMVLAWVVFDTFDMDFVWVWVHWNARSRVLFMLLKNAFDLFFGLLIPPLAKLAWLPEGPSKILSNLSVESHVKT